MTEQPPGNRTPGTDAPGSATPDDHAAGVEAQVRSAVEAGRDVAAEVERITRDALASGKLDVDRARAVVEAVGRGASAGAGGTGDEARHSVSQAVDGLQRTLIRSADDARLAIQEATSRIGDFSRGELDRRLGEMRGLEGMMLDSLSSTAKASSAAGAEVLDDLVMHARRSGTRLGDEVESNMRTLAQSLPEAMRETVLAGIGAARESGALAAEAASGLLSGVAGALRQASGTPRGAGDAASAGAKGTGGAPGGGDGGERGGSSG